MRVKLVDAPVDDQQNDEMVAPEEVERVEPHGGEPIPDSCILGDMIEDAIEELAEKPEKPTYEALEAECATLRAAVGRLAGAVRQRDEQVAALRKSPRAALKLDTEAKDRFRRPIGRR